MEKPQIFDKYRLQGAYHWASVLPSWKTTYNPFLDARYKKALSVTPHPAKEGALAVDLGCGDGYFSHLLGSLGYRVFGVDGDRSAIELAKNLNNNPNGAEFTQGNVYQVPLPDESADFVSTLDVIEHLDDPVKFLVEIKRLAKKDATVLIGTPIRITEKPLDKYHVREFFPLEFEQILKQHFAEVSVRKSHPAELLALMRKKYSFFGKSKNLAWNLINLYIVFTGKNPLLNENCEFPSYQFAICKK